MKEIPSLEELERIAEFQERFENRKPDVNTEYKLFPKKDEVFHIIGEPTFNQGKDAAKQIIKRRRQKQFIIDEHCHTYGFKYDEKSVFKSDLEYYKAILPLVTMENIKISEGDFSPLVADRMVRDFFELTFG